MEEEGGTGDEATTFGSALLGALKRCGASIGAFDYATIQELKAADREETIRILREHSSNLSYAAIRAIREDDPEEIAQRIAEENRRTKMTLLLFLALLD